MKIPWKKLKFFDEGKRGQIYQWKKGKTILMVKVKKPESKAYGRIENEYNVLKVLNKKGIGPRVKAGSAEYLVYEYVPGKRIGDVLATTKNPKLILKKVLEQCFTLDQMKFSKEEMHNPYKHILVNKNKVVMIDFERCHKTDKPKNVSQFCQYILNRAEKLEEKGIKISREKVMQAIKRYKKAQSKENFQKLMQMLF